MATRNTNFSIPMRTLLAAFCVVITLVSCAEETEPTEHGMTREQRIQELFSPWDGSQPAVVDWIKQNIKDPNSFEHLETKYIDRGDTISVVTEFTATNSFGGRVRTTCMGYVDTTGKLFYAELLE